MSHHRQPDTAADCPASRGDPSFAEFVIIIASCMAVVALAIDLMLPALPQIGGSFRVSDPNDRQWVITAFSLGLGLGSLLFGPLSDQFGRRPVLLSALVLFVLSCLAIMFAPTFEMLVAGRFLSGFFAAAGRTVATGIVRDRFRGDAMARVISLAMIIFLIVPIVAPSLGQFLLLFMDWHHLFGVLALLALVLATALFLRLRETLAPDRRVPFRPAALLATFRMVAFHRNAMAHTLASGILMGGLYAFLLSIQQVVYDTFGMGEHFGVTFALIAGSMAVGSFCNSRLVGRLGARRISQAGIFMFILTAVGHLTLAIFAPDAFLMFVALQALSNLTLSFAAANLSSIAMDPFSQGAGMAASVQASVTTILSTALGAFIGSRFDGTMVPIATGYLCCGLVALLVILWGERGRLFVRTGIQRDPPGL